MQSKTMPEGITLIDLGPLTRIKAHLRDLIEIYLTSLHTPIKCYTLKEFRYVSDEKLDDKLFMHVSLQAKEPVHGEVITLGLTFIVSKIGP